MYLVKGSDLAVTQIFPFLKNIRSATDIFTMIKMSKEWEAIW